MTKNEKQDLEALKIGFENTEWEDFLLVLNEIRNRDKEIIAMYRKSHIELKELKKALAKEENFNIPELSEKQEPEALIIGGVSVSFKTLLMESHRFYELAKKAQTKREELILASKSLMCRELASKALHESENER